MNRMSQLLIPTLREVPGDAEIASHRLMLRAGLMRKVAGGVYTYLPLGLKVIRKVEEIIRQEMNRAGGQELLLPILQPAELWQETGRWGEYGPEMWRLTDRHERQFCLGPTHEELITDLVRSELSSYRQLPLLLYQIQNKYRDEVRPRFGVMRAREFIMKDLYSFDRDEEGMEISYRRMYDAYARVFQRCGLEFLAVDADPGAIGGSGTHEFTALADYGESLIICCEECGYAANVEKAESGTRPADSAGESPQTLNRLETPGVKTIPELAAFLGANPERMVKTLFYGVLYPGGREELVAVLVRGDRELNEIKLKNHLDALQVFLARSGDVERETGTVTGYAGPVGLGGVRLLVDPEVKNLVNAYTGANQEGRHLANVNFGRDYQGEVVDLRQAAAGDPCITCGTPLRSRRGIEVGQVFKLWTEYSRKLGAVFHDEDGLEKPVYMGCYGIGVTRTVAAIIEQHHDDRGIAWPRATAPFEAAVIPVHIGDERQRRAAEAAHAALLDAGIDAVLDDRDERPGVKFADAELIGIPIRVTVGPRSLENGQVELRARRQQEDVLVALPEVARTAGEFLRGLP